MRFLFASLVSCLAMNAQAEGMDAANWMPVSHGSLLDATYLIELQQGSRLSQTAQQLRSGGYELADGQAVHFRNWYTPRRATISMLWMTQLTDRFGILWGGSTGERAEKYHIQPSLKLGVVMQLPTGKQATLSMKASMTFGGRLREHPCTADYGDIGGIQSVNCRLAATPLAPADTLNYLLDEQPYDRKTVSIQWQYHF